MPLFSRAEITTLEEPSRITFQIERERGGIERAIAAAGVLFSFVVWYEYHNRFWLDLALIGAVMTLVDGVRGGRTELIVTSNELLARGNLGRIFSSEISIKTADVTGMGYQVGDEGTASGLYVKHGWRNTCLVRGISELQTNQMLDEILRHFPEIPRCDSRPGSLLFGRSRDITKLGMK